MNRFQEKFRTVYRKNKDDFTAIILGRYPKFVYQSSAKLKKIEIPIFVFHSVQPEIFEHQIKYLSQNGYRTLTADQLYSVITSGINSREKSAVLTFDDGRASLWTTAFPILKKYNQTAICFLVPHWIKNESIANSTVVDLWAGRVGRSEIFKREVSEPLCTWKEIISMHESGLIDFQSHTSYHHTVFISDKLIDFINPNLLPSFLDSDLNCVIRKNDKDDYSGDIEWGQPVYQYSPSMVATRRYIEDEKLNHACVTFVKERGGKSFFEERGWRSKLMNCYQAFINKNKINDKYQSAEERYREIKADLLNSRKMIEEKLRKKVHHLCYPWYAGGKLSVRASKDAGYLSNYWGILNKKAINLIGQSPMYLSRLNDEYIFALPGKGRKSLLKILVEKAWRLQSRKRFSKTQNL